MNDTIVLILIIVASLFLLYFLYRFFAPYFIRITHIFYVSGSPGTGKDVISHKYALARYKLAVRKYKKEKFFFNLRQLFKKKTNRLKYLEKEPVFMSSIPILIKFKKGNPVISHPIDFDVLLLQKRLPNYSVIYISDINRFINQWSYKNENVQENISEFISEYRHYTKGGYFIANSQASSQVAKEIRNTFGKVRNLLSFKKLLWFYKIEGRTITLSEDVLAVEQGDADKKNLNSSNIYGFLNPFIYRYDTYAYHGRITEMSFSKIERYYTKNTNTFFEIPAKKVQPLTINELKDYKVYFKFKKFKAFIYFIIFSILGLVISALFSHGLPFFIFITLYLFMLYDALN